MKGTVVSLAFTALLGVCFLDSCATIETSNTNGVGSVFANTGFFNPEGLTFDSGGNLYVASYGNDRIYKFDATGELMRAMSD